MSGSGSETAAACVIRPDGAPRDCRSAFRDAQRARVRELVLDGASVFLASRRRTGAVHERLIADLLDGYGESCRRGPGRVRLDHGPFGRPMLVDCATGCEGDLAISFTHAWLESWAAMASVRVGIDVADPREFSPPYPYHRAFSDHDLRVIRSCGGDRPSETAACLWSLKEAALKAVGCGFHRADYRDVEVKQQAGAIGLTRFVVHVGGLAVDAWATREGPAWLAIALSM